MPGRKSAELTAKVAKILKDPVMPKNSPKNKKAKTYLTNRTWYLHLTIDICVYLCYIIARGDLDE